MIKTSDVSNEIIDLAPELVLLDNVNLPFSSLLLKQGTDKINSIYADWKYENLDTSSGTAMEGADITTYQSSSRKTGDKNICEIIEKAVSVSGTAQSVKLNDVSDLFAHEVQNRMLEAKRDLENDLINGVYREEDATHSRQMKGLVNFITSANTVSKSAYPALADLSALTKIMRKAGTSSQNLVMLCDYNMTDCIQTLFDSEQRYVNVQNAFGSVVKHVNLTYGGADIYTIDNMPTDTLILANMQYLKLAELRSLAYEDLAKTGDSRKGFIRMENCLKFINPNAAVMFKKVAA